MDKRIKRNVLHRNKKLIVSCVGIKGGGAIDGKEVIRLTKLLIIFFW